MYLSPQAPASFGLVTYLLHEGLDRARVRKHLLVFCLAAPSAAIATFLLLLSRSVLFSHLKLSSHSPNPKAVPNQKVQLFRMISSLLI